MPWASFSVAIASSVHLEAEHALVDVEPGDVRSRCVGNIQLSHDLPRRFRQFVQELRPDGQLVAPGKLQDFALVTETGAHHDCTVPEFLVVRPNLLYRQYARVLMCCNVFHSTTGLVPVQNTSHKRRYKRSTRFCCSNLGLVNGEQQRHVAVNAFAFEDFRGLNAFPCARDLDQNAALVNAGRRVQRNQVACFRHRCLRVERQASIHLRRHNPRHDIQDLDAEIDGKLVERLVDITVTELDRIVDQCAVFRHGRRRKQQARVRRGIRRLEQLDRIDVAGVGDDDRPGGDQAVQLRHAGR